MSTGTRWLLAALLVVLVGASHLLDDYDEATTARLVAADKADAIAQARRDAHRKAQ